MPFIPNEERSELLNRPPPFDNRRFKLYWKIDEMIKSIIPSKGRESDLRFEIMKMRYTKAKGLVPEVKGKKSHR